MNKLVRVPGIVISASVLSSRATKLTLQCSNCHSYKFIYPQGGLGGLGSGSERGLPRKCDASPPGGEANSCPLDPYIIIHQKSTFTDQQTLKLQEAPDMVPVGELPRHMLLSTDRYLTGRMVPGSRVIVTGIYSTFQSVKNVRCFKLSSRQFPGKLASEKRRASCTTAALPACSSSGIGISWRCCWDESFWSSIHSRGGRRFRRNGSKWRFLWAVCQKCCAKYIWKSRSAVSNQSLSPVLQWNLDIKKAITCLLFGGSKKVLPDGMRLRGDINVLLLGDPGTAKSQLLKFVEKVCYHVFVLYLFSRSDKGRAHCSLYIRQRLQCCWFDGLSPAWCSLGKDVSAISWRMFSFLWIAGVLSRRRSNGAGWYWCGMYWRVWQDEGWRSSGHSRSYGTANNFDC